MGDRFRIDALIGEGGTARVFRATDLKTGQLVAIKVLRESLLGSVDSVARFRHEADLLGALEHPNIPLLVGRGEQGRSLWFASPFAARGSLADRMVRQGTLSSAEMLGYAVEVLDALQYLHERGIVHRDVKPENVLIDEKDVAMLCDFGIALGPKHTSDALPSDALPSQQGYNFGTPSFMPPEQYDDPGSVTAQADLFGLGVTLFVALTGHSGMALLVAHLRPEMLGSLPAAIRAVVDRATSLRIEDRYPSAREMALDVADAMEES